MLKKAPAEASFIPSPIVWQGMPAGDPLPYKCHFLGSQPVEEAPNLLKAMCRFNVGGTFSFFLDPGSSPLWDASESPES